MKNIWIYVKVKLRVENDIYKQDYFSMLCDIGLFAKYKAS